MSDNDDDEFILRYKKRKEEADSMLLHIFSFYVDNPMMELYLRLRRATIKKYGKDIVLKEEAGQVI